MAEEIKPLSSHSSTRANVEAWSCYRSPNKKEVDSEFVASVYYHNHNDDIDGTTKTTTFRLKREILDEVSEHEQWQSVMDWKWLEELGVDQDDIAFGATINVVLEAFEEMLGQVATQGRKCLDMVVRIEILRDHEDEDEEEEVEYDYEEYVEMVEDLVEVKIEEKLGTAKVILSTSGVKFGSVSSLIMPDKEEGSSCAICLDKFEDDTTKTSSDDYDPMEEIAVLPCSHILHQDCLLPWVVKGNSSTCPLCRSNILQTCALCTL